MLWTAFLLGLVGSTHCLVMCGPLTLLLPGQKSIQPKVVAGKLVYNFGRILMYGVLGFLIGSISQQTVLFASQRSISIAIGILILLFLAVHLWSKKSIKIASYLSMSTSKIKFWIKNSLKLNFWGSHFSFGLVNGLLPCGLSYAALAGSFLALHPLDGSIYMLVFGLGTLPMMLAASLGFSKIRSMAQINFKKILPYTYAAMAIWLLFRGFTHEPSLYGNQREVHTECITGIHE
jgi:sulfite exporter TauE/SafE